MEEDEKKLRKQEKIRVVGTPSPVWIGAPVYDSSFNEVIGVIALQDYKDKNAYNKDDVHTLSIIAANIGIFIERINNLEKLKKAKEKAEESDRLKTAFLANMSHEIRTPMNGIMGFTNLLKESGLSSDEKDKYADIIQKSGERLMNTVNDIIEVSKLESNLVPVETKEINANKLVKELVDFFQSEAGDKGLSLTIDRLLPEKASIFYTDRSKFESVLTNLIKNAIKYTDSGGSVTVTQSRGADGEVHLTVADTERVATLPGAIGVEVGPDGTVYVAVATGDDDAGVWAAPSDGEASQLTAIGGFPNDVLFDAERDRLLVTESEGGVVYSVGTDGSRETWLDDDRLSTEGFGANGIARGDGTVSVAVTQAGEAGRLVEGPVQSDGSAGDAVTRLESEAILGADGIPRRGDGLYVAANSQNRVVRVDADGETETIADGDDGLVFPSDVSFAPGSDGLFVCNFANQSPEDGAILRVGP